MGGISKCGLAQIIGISNISKKITSIKFNCTKIKNLPITNVYCDNIYSDSKIIRKLNWFYFCHNTHTKENLFKYIPLQLLSFNYNNINININTINDIVSVNNIEIPIILGDISLSSILFNI